MNGEVFIGLAIICLGFLFVVGLLWKGGKELYRFLKGDLKELDEEEDRKSKKVAVAKSRSGDRADREFGNELQRRSARRSPSPPPEIDDAECDALAARMDS